MRPIFAGERKLSIDGGLTLWHPFAVGSPTISGVSAIKSATFAAVGPC